MTDEEGKTWELAIKAWDKLSSQIGFETRRDAFLQGYFIGTKKSSTNLSGQEFEIGREMLDIQGMDGTFNYSPYDHGLYNGMEFMLSLIEEREPVFRDAPKKWIHEGKFKTFLRSLFNKPKHKVINID